MFGKFLILLCAAACIVGFAARGSSGAGPRQIYVVKPGDTLWAIAASHFSGDPRQGIWQLEQRNRLTSATISPGEKLVLP